MIFSRDWRKSLRTPRLSPRAFSRAVRAAIRDLVPDSKVDHAGDLELTVKLQDGNEVQLWLGNVYSTLLPEHSERIEAVESLVRGITESPFGDDVPPPDIDSIVPQIKDERFIAEINQIGDGDLPPHVSEHLVADLHILYSSDTEMAIRPLREDDLPVIGISRENVPETALDNLKRILPPVETHQNDVCGMLTCGGSYEASLLLFDDLWSEIERNLPGPLLACVPARDMLLYGDSNDSRTLDMICEVADEVEAGGGYLISRTILIRNDGRWHEFERGN